MMRRSGLYHRDDSDIPYPYNQYYFKSPEQMRRLFREIPEAADNTLALAERCGVIHFQ
jgi:DNA polymerase-3 subunit alpha